MNEPVSPARSATIVDVARRANVSKTTASDALSGSGRVSEGTRRRIVEAAGELGYVPNAAARHLRSARTGTIALHIPQRAMGLTFYMEFAFAAARRAQDHGLDLTLLAPGDRTTGTPQIRADGIILIDPMPTDPVATALARVSLPLVCVGQFQTTGSTPAGLLHADHGAAMRELMDHLARAGATAPAFIGTDDDFQSDWAVLIRRTYEDWCHQHDITPHIGAVATDAPTAATSTLVTDMLTRRPDTDALICGPDGTAQIAHHTLQNLGRTIGRDILLAACVDSPALTLCTPPVTAINLRPQPYGHQAVELLTDLLTGTAQAPTERHHPIELITRTSTSRTASALA
ncbi:LacI family DNA-binding transcriptional regulator [Streptomyces rishiriensis]|uniref:DNA-binding LacI/PurR family transcriptional regulator n=1 Tax=Streptomyces rishiriensis TaxID=68264 RepID=A0ABU0NG43_STRRH|nr:LacI family DNA-binding transcriptional regulator [Streptomyces rishiriensis]MDQ0578077.1 DNA-binding LacI/PurR family transcriptional regulator [Streptomyces rishiriensis]